MFEWNSGRIASALLVALVALQLDLLLTISSPAQSPTADGIVANLQSADAQKVANVIASLSEDHLLNDAIVGQLTLLLDDNRTVVKHIMGREIVQDRAWFKLRTMPSTSVASLVQKIPHLKSDRSRGRALEIVSYRGKGNAELYSQILEYCKHEDSYVRSRAISASSAVGSSSLTTIEQFGTFLRDPEPIVRWVALDALDKRHAQLESLIPAIIKLLDDDSDVYRAISAGMLIPEKLRGRVARLLANVGPAAISALPKLNTLTGEGNETNVRIWAATAICKITESPPQASLHLLGDILVEDLSDEHADNDCLEAIAVLGEKAAPLLKYMEKAKQHRSSLIRIGLVNAFFAVDPDSAINRAFPLIYDSDGFVAGAVINSLSTRNISDTRVIGAYIRALERHDDIFNEPAASAVLALETLGNKAKPAIPALELLLQDTEISEELRKKVRHALARIQ